MNNNNNTNKKNNKNNKNKTDYGSINNFAFSQWIIAVT